MRFKDVRLLRAKILHDLALHFQNLLAGLNKRFFKAAGFPGHFGSRNFTPGDDVAGTMKHEDLPAANAVGDGNAPKNLLSFLEPLGHAGEIAEIVRVEKQLHRKRVEC